MSSLAYLSQKLTRPIPIRDAREYMVALPGGRALREQWQVAAKMIIEHPSVPALGRQVERPLSGTNPKIL
jgi:hypothetical protein